MMAKTGTAVPWKQLLLDALDSNAHLKHSSFFQLATVGYNGRPSNRTLIFRGFQGDTDKIQIHTDSTSRKICWYFTESWEQFRIKGRIDIVDGSNPDPVNLQEREKSWFARSPRSRLLYLDPGHPLVDEESPKEVSIDPSAGPVDAFCLLVHDPEQVDYLNLKSNQRLTFTSRHKVNGDKWWTSEKINP
ncbi:pyridoxine/pyridoxamine 5'-phosphate oxidase 2-like isoform X2 [Ziziphus jujuba]|uniref:pyridoxal 5'-phosphate synthase n=1 Tax=Ziziphus jujuba TaxID=326968 RepID=A0ABM3IUK7_ZIZJJ|nr:pyridoxine/pyridoxamine 5'-phosphate oxidase 2-like isoform X2 [Ziziphus jujuba]